MPSKSPNGKNLRKFGVWEANQSTPSEFSSVSVNTFYEFWKLLNLATADYVSNKCIESFIQRKVNDVI